jgi:hypothetical protein
MEKKLVFLALFVFLFTSAYTQNSQWEWAKSIGTSLDDNIDASVQLYAPKVAFDSKGNMYVAGLFSDTMSFADSVISTKRSGYEVDMFVAKYSPSGEEKWIRRFGIRGSEFLTGIAIDSKDNVYVTGGFDGGYFIDGDTSSMSRGEVDCFLLAFTSDGNLQLVTTFGSDKDDLATDLASDGENIFIIGGYLGNDFYSFGKELSNKSFFIIKLNTNGTVSWVSDLAENQAYIKPSKVTPDHKGGCYVSGNLSNIIIGTDTLSTVNFDNNSIIHITGDGLVDWKQIIRNCEIVDISATPNNLCVLANFQDSVVLNDTTYESPLLYKSTPSVLSAVFSSEGTFKNVVFGNGYQHVGYDVCTDSIGRFIISGRCGRLISFGNVTDTVETINSNAGFVTRIDINGNVSLLTTLPTIPTVFLTSVAVNSQNEIGITGFYRDSIRIGSTLLNAVSSDPDILVTKIGIKSSAQHKKNSFDNNKLFPNPASTIANVNYLLPSSSPVTITFHDILGREVLRREMGVQTEGQHEESVDVSKLPIGSYIVKISTNQEVFTSRISVVR